MTQISNYPYIKIILSEKPYYRNFFFWVEKPSNKKKTKGTAEQLTNERKTWPFQPQKDSKYC